MLGWGRSVGEGWVGGDSFLFPNPEEVKLTLPVPEYKPLFSASHGHPGGCRGLARWWGWVGGGGGEMGRGGGVGLLKAEKKS